MEGDGVTQTTSTNPAETYESYMVPALFRPCAERLLQSAAPEPGQRVLDIATGTGVVARLVRPRLGPAGRVTAIDVSPDMLAVARGCAEREGLDIEWREAPAEKLPLPDAGYDLALCQFALMFFADRAAALSEARRVLAAGGRLALNVFEGIERHPFYMALDHAIQQRLGVSAVAGIFSLGDAGALESLIAEAGFEDVIIERVALTSRFPNPEAFLAGEIDVDTAALPAMQHLSAAERAAITESIRDEMQEPLRDVTDGDHVALEFHVLVATAARG
jgi:ubiquinone/menaquinone biosynthesis C-methylase UbiE